MTEYENMGLGEEEQELETPQEGQEVAQESENVTEGEQEGNEAEE